MCGICGFVSAGDTLPRSLLERMNATIRRRGPDGEGYLYEDGVGLAMRRLAIIDLAGGDQPIFNESGTLGIVFNGEIYNYRELRERLARLGHSFRTHSDTEVIVHLFEEYGLDAPTYLEGMFAFALWNRETRRVVLCRDRLGIKPLFYAACSHGVFFGSEIKALLASGLVARRLDFQAIDEYLTYTNVPCPRTIYADIRQLPPGSTLTISADGQLTTHRYWSPPSMPEDERTPSEWISAGEQALRAAVESHLVSDVPVGAFLSGGVDSGLMVALMADIMKRPVEAFTVAFQDAGSAFIDERIYARSIAKRYGLNHHVIEVVPNVEGIIEELIEALDQPFADDSIIPSYYVCKAAAQHVKVALTGLGGDELFGGYRRHVGLSLGDRYAKVPAWTREKIAAPLIRRLPESSNSSDIVDHLKRFVRASGASPALRYQDSLATLSWQERRALYTPEVLSSVISPEATQDIIVRPFCEGTHGSSVERALRTDLGTYLVDDILTLTDRLSMWHSLELRVPYLDHRLVELAASIPTHLKVRGLSQKILLKRIAERWLPREAIYHRKQGFEAPMGRWLRGPLLPYFDHVVSRERVEQSGIFRFDEIWRLRCEHVSGQHKHSKILFSVLMYHAWQQSQASHVDA